MPIRVEAWVMLKQIGVLVAACWMGGTAVLAQGSGTDGSQLGFYIGKWTVEGQSRSTPTGAYGRISGNETCAWFSGGPALVCRETLQDSAGETDSIFILSFDSKKKQYTVHGTDNTGTMTMATGTLADGVWRWQGESRSNDGVVTPTRYTFREAPGGGRTMDVEVMNRNAWTKIVGVTYKRAR
ncbi:MAG: hypothetical protein QM736_18255 [Vicinamibacterales bacterium]